MTWILTTDWSTPTSHLQNKNNSRLQLMDLRLIWVTVIWSTLKTSKYFYDWGFYILFAHRQKCFEAQQRVLRGCFCFDGLKSETEVFSDSVYDPKYPGVVIRQIILCIYPFWLPWTLTLAEESELSLSMESDMAWVNISEKLAFWAKIQLKIPILKLFSANFSFR